MALTWDVTAIADHDTITTHPEDLDKTEGRRWSPITEALVWATMHVGIGRITEDNADDFWKRVRMMEHINPSIQAQEWEPRLTEKDVREHIGLRTNASPMTFAKFKGRLVEWLDRESERDARARDYVREGKSLREQMTERVKAQKAKAD